MNYRRLWALTATVVFATWLGVLTGGPPLWAWSPVAVVLVRRSLAVCLIVFLLVWSNAARLTSADGDLERVAGDVSRCDLGGWVSDPDERLGTTIHIEELRCDDEMLTGGSVVSDDHIGSPGAPVTGNVLLSPLEEEGFDRTLRMRGASARVQGEFDVGPPAAPVYALAARIREGALRAGEGVGGDAGGLLAGLTVGDTTMMTEPFQDVMRAAGLSHLVAVSGSNVAIVTGSVVLLTASLGAPVSAGAGALALILYVVVVGPDPSVLRAAAMGALALFALACGRRTETAAALALAVMAVLVLRPMLIASVGLQLSALATAGLIAWASRLHHKLPGPRLLTVPLAVTISAQVAVAPVLIAVFGEISLVGPVANLMAAPAVGPATVLGLLAAIADLVAPSVGGWLTIAAGPFVHAIAWIGTTFGRPEWATIGVPPVVAWPLGFAVGLGLVAGLRR